MAFIPALIAGISGIAGGLFGQPQTTQTGGNQQSTSSGTQSTAQNSSGSSLPNYDPLQMQMRNYLLGQFFQQSNPNAISSLVNNYTGQGTNTINQNSNSNEQAIQAYLTAQGLSNSPAASTALLNNNASRVGQINSLESQAPILGNQLQNQYLSNFANFFSGLPVGQNQQQTANGVQNTNGSQNTTQSGTVTTPNTSLASGISGLGSSLGLLYGLGAFRPSGGSGGSVSIGGN